MWGQSAMEDVHICACNTRSMSHDSIFRFKATLGHFSSSHVCAKLWSFSLRLKLNFMILFISNFNWIHGVGWACCPKGPWKFGIASTPPTLPGFDISARFHPFYGIPLHNTCKEWWPWERSQGSQMCWDSNLFWFIPVLYINKWLTPHKHAGQWQTLICPCFLPDI